MEREKFYVDGRFDSEHIYVDSVIMLNDNEGKRFLARVIAMDNETVTLDTNHPLAGKTLQFTGEVLTNRDATKEEIQSILNQLSHECGGCGGHCGGCGGDDCGEDHECGGGCGHCH
jgi:FKBP-type peptidyl-prolyl cis-trans isomerase SlyD